MSVGQTNLGEPLAWAWCRDCGLSHCPYGRHVVEHTLKIPGETQGRSKNVRVCVTGECAGLHAGTERLLGQLHPRHGRAAMLLLDDLLRARATERARNPLPTEWRRGYVEHLVRVGGSLLGVDVANAEPGAFTGTGMSAQELLGSAGLMKE